MPIRAIVIMLVAAVVLATCYREPIYKWFKESMNKSQPDKENEETSKEEKENQE